MKKHCSMHQYSRKNMYSQWNCWELDAGLSTIFYPYNVRICSNSRVMHLWLLFKDYIIVMIYGKCVWRTGAMRMVGEKFPEPIELYIAINTMMIFLCYSDFVVINGRAIERGGEKEKELPCPGSLLTWLQQAGLGWAKIQRKELTVSLLQHRSPSTWPLLFLVHKKGE